MTANRWTMTHGVRFDLGRAVPGRPVAALPVVWRGGTSHRSTA